MTASGTLISGASMTSGRTALTPRWKTGVVSASLSPGMDVWPMANGWCLKAGLTNPPPGPGRKISLAHPGGHYGYQWWNNAIPANAQHVDPSARQGLKDAVGAGYLRPGDYGQPRGHLVIGSGQLAQGDLRLPSSVLLTALMYSAIALNCTKGYRALFHPGQARRKSVEGGVAVA